MTFADGIGAGCVCARSNKISLVAVIAQVSRRQVASAEAYILFYTRRRPELALAAPSSPTLPPPTVLGGSGRSKSGTVRPTVDTDGSVDRPDASHVGEGIPVQRSGGAPTSREASRPPSLPEATDTTDRDDTRTGGKWHKKRRRGGKGGRKKGPPNRR